MVPEINQLLSFLKTSLTSGHLLLFLAILAFTITFLLLFLVVRKNSKLKTKNTILAAKLESEQNHHREKLAMLDEAKENMRLQFSELAQRIFDEKTNQFSNLSKEKLEAILTPLGSELSTLREHINSVYHNDIRERASLKQEIHNLRELNVQITNEAANLARALKGDKKLQGNWGELILERVLEQSGLRKGIEFETQAAYRDQQNELLKPDVIIHLPDNRHIIVDSKVSLANWEKYTTTDSEDEKESYLKQLMADVKNHIKGLSGKDYTKLEAVQSLDFVLMFMPIEAAFSSLVQYDEDLLSFGLKEKIIIVTPTTLLASLKTIENIWRLHQQTKNSKEIAIKASSMYDKFCLFLEDMEKLGRQLSICQKSFDSAVNKLSSGRGNLISQTEQLKELGVQPKKNISDSFNSQHPLS